MTQTREAEFRVAIVADSTAQREALRGILEACGLQVVDEGEFANQPVGTISKTTADVLLVDLDDSVDHGNEYLDELLDSQLPILFNDSTGMRLNAARNKCDWGRNLARKLSALVQPRQTPTDPLHNPPSRQTAHAERKSIAGEFDATPSGEAQALEDSPHGLEAGPLPLISPDNPDSAAELAVRTLHGYKSVDSLLAPATRVCILGASIGGPQSVKRFLNAIPANLPIAFVLAQHIGSGFVEILAQQLDRVSSFKVMPALSGHLLRHHQVVIAPVSERVLVDKQGRIELQANRTRSIYSPSIDMVMTDIAIRYGARASAIVFSGMGSDGVRGSQVVASRGGWVWAQDAGSCVISSMPDAARRAGIVSFSGSPELLAMEFSKRILREAS